MQKNENLSYKVDTTVLVTHGIPNLYKIFYYLQNLNSKIQLLNFPWFDSTN